MSYTLKLSQDHDGRRLDRTIRSTWKWVTLGEIMKAIRKGEVRVNGVRVRDGGEHVKAGDELCVPWPLKDDGRVIPHSSWGKIQVIHQGNNVLILNKPAGILVQPDEAGGDSVISRVWGVLGTKTPAAVHRLDRNTTGVLAVALHGDSLRALEALFKARRVRKFYTAIVVGTVEPEIMIDAPLLKDSENNKVSVSDEGQSAKTHCTRLATDAQGKFSLVKLELLTGRTHQARVHMAHIKHPILGDRKYGDFRINRIEKGISRPMLHAYELEFPEDIHASLKEIAGKTFRAEIPGDMKAFMEARGLNI